MSDNVIAVSFLMSTTVDVKITSKKYVQLRYLFVFFYCLGWLFDVTGDFRYVFYIISANSLLAAFLLFLCTRLTTDSRLAKKIPIKTNNVKNNEPTASHVQRAAVIETFYETSL